ncbi:hypothetical protein V8F06_006302 [Rhypophila decipiens]
MHGKRRHCLFSCHNELERKSKGKSFAGFLIVTDALHIIGGVLGQALTSPLLISATLYIIFCIFVHISTILGNEYTEHSELLGCLTLVSGE